jgi:hypothetical protein
MQLNIGIDKIEVKHITNLLKTKIVFDEEMINIIRNADCFTVIDFTKSPTKTYEIDLCFKKVKKIYKKTL